MKKNTWINLGFQVGALLLALLITTSSWWLPGRRRLKAFLSILKGAFGSTRNVVAVLITWSPLLLTTAGVLITFSAGLWNIGMEGQMTLGAIFATGMLRLLQDTSLPPALIIILGILAGIARRGIVGCAWPARSKPLAG